MAGQPTISHEVSLDTLQASPQDIPSDSWWSQADTAFAHLTSIISQHGLPSNSSFASKATDAQAISPNAARVNASPTVTILKTGTHLMRLAVPTEELACIAFGTISSDLFHEVFWDNVGEMRKGGLEVLVYEASDPSKDLFRFSMGGLAFRMLYFHSMELLRSYPNIVDAPETFVQKRDNCDAGTANTLAIYHQSRKMAEVFKNRSAKLAYYYLREWAHVRFCFESKTLKSGFITPRMIIEQLEKVFTKLPRGATVNVIVSTFFKEKDVSNWGYSMSIQERPHFTMSEEQNATDALRLMATLKNQILPHRLSFCSYLLISVMWTGTGSQGSQWIRMVDRKVVLLRSRVSNMLRTYSSANSRPYLVPSRLIRPSSAKTETYEAFYLLGFPTTNQGLVEKFQQISSNWLLSVREEDTLSNGKGFIHAELKSPQGIGSENYSLCRRVWTEKPIKGPLKDVDIDADSDTPSHLRRSQTKPTATSFPEIFTKGPKLRPASDILNRLRHDERFNIDEWVVGYVDRHSKKMQEKNAVSWETDVTHEEFIPEHRIWWFKKLGMRNELEGDGVVWWDRETKRDWIFGPREV